MQGFGFGGFKTWALAGVSAAAIVSPAWGQEAVRDFNIPAQNVQAALETFGRQGDVDIVFDRNKMGAIRSSAVAGSYAPSEALRRLIAGSGLVMRQVNGTTFIVEPASRTNTASAEQATDLGDIVVTGTHIRGANPTAPVVTVSRTDIERSGYGSVGEVVRSLPQNFSGGQNPGIIGAVDSVNMTNASTINLRGLGSDATLVLLNGRRLPGDAVFQAADISGIPLAAVNRIEVVTDGSSATYGADAVAGVVNMLMRDDFDGTEMSVRLGKATQGGGFEQIYTGLIGRSRTSWRAMANLEYAKQDPITASQRPFTSAATPQTDLQNPQERTSFYGNFGVDLADGIELVVDALASERKSSDYDQSFDFIDPFITTIESPSYSLSAGLTFDLPSDWRLRINGVTSTSKSETWIRFAGTETNQTYRNSVDYLEAILDGSLLQLPGGNLSVALGGGWRTQDFRQTTATGARPVLIDVGRDVGYLFAEVVVPLVAAPGSPGMRELTFSASGRLDDYSDYGSAVVSKIGMRWAPFEGVAIRGTWGESFKATSFLQQYASRNATILPAANLGSTASGTAIWFSGGNPDLKPEQSTSWTIGIDYSPPSLPSAVFTATYFDIDFTDRVVTPISPQRRALVDPAFAPFIVQNPTAAEQQAAFDLATNVRNFSGEPYDPARVVAIAWASNTNAASQRVRGLDIGYRQTFEFGESALHPFANVSLIDLDQRTVPLAPERELDGSIFNVPELRARGGLTWTNGGFSLTGIVNHVSDMRDTGVSPARRISSWTTADATISYDFGPRGGALNDVTVSLSAANLFDIDPPYAETPSFQYTGIYFDSTNSSPIGRFISVFLRKSF